VSKTKQRRAASRRYARVQPKNSWLTDLPLLPIAVGGILLVAAVALLIVGALGGSKTSSSGQVIDGIQCESNEQLAVHYHAHLSILIDGNETILPAGVGIDNADQCLYWMHTHQSDGVVHIEAPKSAASRKFTLGNFFDLWKKPLDSTHVGDTPLSSGQKLVIFVDGKPYSGNPRNVVLGAHTLVVLEVTPPEVNPPPSFTFPSGE
jgi:hypothetical protein